MNLRNDSHPTIHTVTDLPAPYWRPGESILTALTVCGRPVTSEDVWEVVEDVATCRTCRRRMDNE